MSLISTSGIVTFEPPIYTKKHQKQSSWKRTAIILVEGEICEYYSWFIQRRYNLKLNSPLRKAHFTIINDKFEDPLFYDQKVKSLSNVIINFVYDTDVRTNGKYWWLKIESPEALNLRKEFQLGLPFWTFHLTIGYANEKNLFHSEYIHRNIINFP